MLGHVVARVFTEQGYDVITSETRYSGGPADALVETCARSPARTVINCIGVRGGEQLNSVNGLLPQHLALALGAGRLLVHASSDGVFSGNGGPYAVGAPPDAVDPYGTSKRLGELACALGPSAASVVVLRTSIVGPELTMPPRHLLGWFLSQSGSATGYDDQLWSGVTTLEWARAALRAARGDRAMFPGIHQLAPTEGVTKCRLLELIADGFGAATLVRPASSGKPLDRRLIPSTTCPPIGQQLRELRQWYGMGAPA
jgi:dTDP-4-dehydrorhamnose reductase